MFLIFRKYTGVFRDRAVSGNNTHTHTKHTHVGKKERGRGKEKKGKCDKTLIGEHG